MTFELMLKESHIIDSRVEIFQDFKMVVIPCYDVFKRDLVWKIVSIGVENISDLARLIKIVTDNNLGSFRLIPGSTTFGNYEIVVMNYGLK